MNPSLIKAAKEIAERSGRSFNEILGCLQTNWTVLTGQPVYLGVPSQMASMNANADSSAEVRSVRWYESLDDLY
jgi:hypothetical protein